MKDEWLNELRDRLDGYETDAPEGLRERIARQTWNKRHRFTLLPGIRTAAAAAAIAVALTGIYHIESGKEINLENIAESGNNISIQEEVNNGNTPKPNNLLTEAVLPDNKTAIIRKTVTETEIIEKLDETSTEQEVNAGSVNEQSRPEESDRLPANETPSTENVTKHNSSSDNSRYFPTRRQNINRNYSHQSKISLGVFTSGSTATSQSRTSGNGLIASAIGPDNASWHDSPMLGILTYNRGRETTSDIKHRLPVRAGLTVAYQLNSRMSVETGVSYTRLVSDIHEGSDSHYLNGKQTLQYVGVPINLKYRILSLGKADIYGAAGVLAEKCVSGKLTKKYVLDNNSTQSESEKITVKRPQWSVNASAGVQYNFSKAVGLYAEPGISYHFDNGSKVRTIYSDRRLDFDLNVGLRFTVGK